MRDRLADVQELALMYARERVRRSLGGSLDVDRCPWCGVPVEARNRDESGRCRFCWDGERLPF